MPFLTWNGHAYPLPRGDRGTKTGPAGPPVQRQAVTPRTQIFPFHLRMNGGALTSVSTPRLQGPGLIRDLWYRFDTAGDPPTDCLELGVATSAVKQQDAAAGTIKPWQRIGTYMQTAAFEIQIGGDGFPVWSLFENISGSTKGSIPVDHLVTLPEWFLVVAFSKQTAGGVARCLGWVRTIENVNPATIEALR